MVALPVAEALLGCLLGNAEGRAHHRPGVPSGACVRHGLVQVALGVGEGLVRRDDGPEVRGVACLDGGRVELVEPLLGVVVGGSGLVLGDGNGIT
jgi:hypothetical protein